MKGLIESVKNYWVKWCDFRDRHQNVSSFMGVLGIILIIAGIIEVLTGC